MEACQLMRNNDFPWIVLHIDIPVDKQVKELRNYSIIFALINLCAY